jgi:hypothetical protein
MSERRWRGVVLYGWLFPAILQRTKIRLDSFPPLVQRVTYTVMKRELHLFETEPSAVPKATISSIRDQ